MSGRARQVLSYIGLAEQVGFDPDEYCWCCRAFVNPITSGICPWCEQLIEQVDLTRLPPRCGVVEPPRPVMLVASQKPRKPKGVKEVLFDTHLDARRQVLEHYARHGSRLYAGQLAVELGVPFSSPESAAGSLLGLCKREGWTADGRYKSSPAAVRAALDAGTWNRVRDPGPGVGGRRGISEDLIHEALWLYLYDELSFRQVAERLIARTTYKNATILKHSLNLEWIQRGWPRRSFHAASKLKGYTMPAGNRRCIATSRNGKPCTRWANNGSSYCTGHRPDRAEERRQLAAIASQAAYADAVSSAPFAYWLRGRLPEVASVAAMHRRICEGAERLGKPRPIDYWQLVQWVAPRQATPCSGHKQRGLKVRRSTVDSILEGWGDGTTFEDVYLVGVGDAA